MADRGDNGVRMHLDRVPQREEGMNPYEIMLSESQERMLFIVKAGQEGKLIEIFERWELDAVAIGEVIEGGNVELFWHGDLVSSIPAKLLTSAVPRYNWPMTPPSDASLTAPLSLDDVPLPKNLGATWLSLLGSPNLCSRRPLYSQYDSTVRVDTAIHPGSDAGVVRVRSVSGKEKGIAISLDCNSRYCAIDAHNGAAHSLAEACRNIAATGATPIGISDCLNMPSPEDPKTMWQIAHCIKGLGEAARAFEVPVVSGNVSLYNQTQGQGIQPTPLLAVVGLMDDVHKAVPSHFKRAGDAILLVGETDPTEIGGSAYVATVHKIERGALPALDYTLERTTCNGIRALIDAGLLSSCHDISDGGLGIALAECCFKDYEAPLGATLKLATSSGRPDGLLFAESGARFIVSCSPNNVAAVKEKLTSQGLTIGGEGTVGGTTIQVEGVAEIDLTAGFDAWFKGLDQIFEA
jgi:phosphoribosylformylglycinamidine synthase